MQGKHLQHGDPPCEVLGGVRWMPYPRECASGNNASIRQIRALRAERNRSPEIDKKAKQDCAFGNAGHPIVLEGWIVRRVPPDVIIHQGIKRRIAGECHGPTENCWVYRFHDIPATSGLDGITER